MTSEVVYGFKGFECLELTPEGKQRLKCKDQWYTVGETAYHCGDIVMCARGFHFCKGLSDINSYYDLSASVIGRVLVPVGGHLIQGVDKCVTDSLHVEELLSGKFESKGSSYVFEHGRLTHRIHTNGSQEWLKDGKRHRDGDLPAYIGAYGTQSWWKDGQRHRDGDFPAIWGDNTQEWWKNGKRHRDGDLPACIYFDGSQEWWKDGVRHRGGDLPSVVHANGIQEWWKYGRRHRDGDLPAVIEADGHHEWWKDGVRHLDGDLLVAAQAATTSRRSNEVDASATQRVRIGDATESAPKAPEGSANVPFATQRVRIEDATQAAVIYSNGTQEWQ